LISFIKQDGTAEELEVFCHLVDHSSEGRLLYLQGRRPRSH
jgi:hypothetical protein